MANSEMSCSAFEEVLEVFLDGELSAEKSRAVESHAAECPACADELGLARRVSQGLAELTPLNCPDVVTARVEHTLSALGETTHSPAAENPAAGVRWSGGFWKIAAAVTLVAAGVVIAVSHSLDPDPVESANTHDSFSPEEVALARKQLEWTLAYVDHVTRSSMRSVSEDVLGKHISPPVKSAVDVLLALEGREENSIQ